MNRATLRQMRRHTVYTVHTNTVVPEPAVYNAMAIAIVLTGSQCEEPHRYSGERFSLDLRQSIFMIYNLPVRALTVLIVAASGLKFGKMLLSFHGWK